MRLSRVLRTVVSLGGISTIAVLIATPLHRQTPTNQTWCGYGANPQHTSTSPVSAGTLGEKWNAPVDLYQNSAGSSHYASPSITAKNTVVIGVKTGQSDGWEYQGRAGSTGALLWNQKTDYS